MIGLYSKLADSPATGAYYGAGQTGYQPVVTGASNSMTFAGFIGQIIGVIDALIPLLISVAVLVFFIGLVQYISQSGDAHAHSKNKQLILWGLVALFVLLSLWGILDFAKTSIFPSA